MAQGLARRLKVMLDDSFFILFLQCMLDTPIVERAKAHSGL